MGENPWHGRDKQDCLSYQNQRGSGRERISKLEISVKYTGVVVPMISPFTPEGLIDEPAVGRVVDRLVGGGVSGIFPLGTTGEAASIVREEKRKLVAATVKAVNGRATVYAGIA